MTVEEFIEALRDYFGEWERPGIERVVARYVEHLHPDVREALVVALIRTVSTGERRAPDVYDIDHVVVSAQVAAAPRLQVTEAAWWWS